MNQLFINEMARLSSLPPTKFRNEAEIAKFQGYSDKLKFRNAPPVITVKADGSLQMKSLKDLRAIR